MKKVILLALFMPVMAYGQILENFETGDLSKWIFYPSERWKADAYQPVNGQMSLHHTFDNPDVGNDRAGIRIANLHPAEGTTKWTFLIRHGYDPSSLNNWSVFLMSDSDPAAMSVDGTSNGFAVGVNLTGADDTLRLWKVKGNVITPVLSSRINWQTMIGITVPVIIVVERTESGKWTFITYLMDGTPLGTSSGYDNELFNHDWFVISYKYSSTRDRLLWIDDITLEGVFYSDAVVPFVTEFRISGNGSADITLSETPDKEFQNVQNFSINGSENPASSCLKISSLTYRVSFTEAFRNKTLNELRIKKICDASANCLIDTSLFFTPARVEKGDILISEIMADPLPEVNLPGKEYLEIVNRTQFPFNLKGWKLTSGDQEAVFPDIIINPLQYKILCSQTDTSNFSSFGKVIGLPQFFALTDGGRVLCLVDSSGNLIHGVEFSSDWYSNTIKSEGGWSLEIIDINFPFYYRGNWVESEYRKGGTPGRINSVSRPNPDVAFTGIQNVFAKDSSSIVIYFTEPVFDLRVTDIEISSQPSELKYLVSSDPLFRNYLLVPEAPLERGEIFEISVSENLTDFAGNRIDINKFSFGLAEEAEPGDLLFNEIMFNPLPGDPDYIELYNNSDKIIDVSRLFFVSVDDETGDTSRTYQLNTENRCILPGKYYAVTTDRQRILERYPGAAGDLIFEISSLPSMPDDKGHIVLFNRQLDKIDEVVYDQSMHYSLLSGKEGIALEKTDPSGKSLASQNWHSASESSGWGTPGARNSVFTEIPITNENVVLSAASITPDNDGNDDILTIKMKLQGNGNVITATVFDENGSLTKRISENLLAGSEATLIWDCTADDGTPVASGIYIILINLYNDSGKKEQWKKVCSVLRR